MGINQMNTGNLKINLLPRTLYTCIIHILLRNNFQQSCGSNVADVIGRATRVASCVNASDVEHLQVTWRRHFESVVSAVSSGHLTAPLWIGGFRGVGLDCWRQWRARCRPWTTRCEDPGPSTRSSCVGAWYVGCQHDKSVRRSSHVWLMY